MNIREAITRVRTETCEFIYGCTECISDDCPYYVLLNTAYKVVNTKQADTPQTDCLTCRYNSDEWDSPKCDSCCKAHSKNHRRKGVDDENKD